MVCSNLSIKGNGYFIIFFVIQSAFVFHVKVSICPIVHCLLIESSMGSVPVTKRVVRYTKEEMPIHHRKNT